MKIYKADTLESYDVLDDTYSIATWVRKHVVDNFSCMYIGKTTVNLQDRIFSFNDTFYEITTDVTQGPVAYIDQLITKQLQDYYGCGEEEYDCDIDVTALSDDRIEELYSEIKSEMGKRGFFDRD